MASTAGEQVAAALAALLAGRLEEGLRSYEVFLKENFPVQSSGLHIRFLGRAGRHDAADRLRNLALHHGANVASHDPRATPAEKVADYERLIASSHVNAGMVAEYLDLLSRLGRAEEVAATLATERLLKSEWLLGENVRENQLLADEVKRLLLDYEEQASYEEAVQSVRKMRRLKHLERLGEPVFDRLIGIFEERTHEYLAAWATSDHPLAHLVPRRFQLGVWALISRGEGFNSRHTHHRGWATGVYYASAVEGATGGGQLKIGPPAELEGQAGWSEIEISPQQGLFVMMPSYYTHWTVPLDQAGLRISVAFDVLPFR